MNTAPRGARGASTLRSCLTIICPITRENLSRSVAQTLLLPRAPGEEDSALRPTWVSWIENQQDLPKGKVILCDLKLHIM